MTNLRDYRDWQPRRWLSSAAAAAAVALSGCGAGQSPSQPRSYTASFKEYAVPVAGNVIGDPFPGSWPDDISFDTDGSIWFAEHHSNEIGRMVPSGPGFVYQGVSVPTANSEMDSIAVDTRRRVAWVTENAGNKIVRYDIPTGTVTEIPVATTANPNPIPGDIAIDPSGNPWFTQPYESTSAPHGAVVKIDPGTNGLTTFPAPTQVGGLDGLTFDPDGSVWFVELNANKIAHLKNGQIIEINLPRPNVIPTNIGRDSKGLIWVTEQGGNANALAVYDPADRSGSPWRELPVPTSDSWPAGIFIDQQDNVWFTEFNTSKIGVKIAGSDQIVDFSIPTANSGPEDIKAAPDGRIFFTEQYGNKIAQISVAGLTP